MYENTHVQTVGIDFSRIRDCDPCNKSEVIQSALCEVECSKIAANEYIKHLNHGGRNVWEYTCTNGHNRLL